MLSSVFINVLSGFSFHLVESENSLNATLEWALSLSVKKEYKIEKLMYKG